MRLPSTTPWPLSVATWRMALPSRISLRYDFFFVFFSFCCFDLVLLLFSLHFMCLRAFFFFYILVYICFCLFVVLFGFYVFSFICLLLCLKKCIYRL